MRRGVLSWRSPFTGGSAAGTFLIANKGAVAKAALKGIGKSFKGPSWKAQDYKDLLCLLFQILKLVRTKGMRKDER